MPAATLIWISDRVRTIGDLGNRARCAIKIEVEVMEMPLQVSFRDIDPSPAVEADIRDKVERLERYFGRIISCRVVVEARHRHRHKGKLYGVRIDLGLPGREIVVNRSGPQDHAHEDVYVAIRDAFDAAKRQMQDRVREARGDIKAHEPPLTGKVLRLMSYEGYGFIATADGQEIYFHKNSVVDNGFDKLAVGSEVRVVLAHGESAQGPQASTVTLIGKHHPVSG